MKKNCLVFETLNQVSELQIEESKQPNTMRMSGIFGVCGVRNQNKRIYEKGNYGKLVEGLLKEILECGLPGELEHPNTMNINLENVSHKIEDIKMNEDGTITGTICLLNTPKGKIAQALVEGGLPLFISSRGAGSIDENGNVTLTTLKTYDLVGTPGFSQARLDLDKNQKFESLNENLCIIYEDEEDKKADDDKDEKKDETTKEEPKETDKKDSEKETDKKEKDTEKDGDEDNKNNTSKEDMNEIKETVDSLKKEVEEIKAQLHVAQESLSDANDTIKSLKENKVVVDYDAIQKWVTEEFAPNFRSEICEGVEKWATKEFAPVIEGWVCNEFAPIVEGWVCNEFAPIVESWTTNEFAPMVEGWVSNEFAPIVEGWVCNEFAPIVEGWVSNEFAPIVEGWVSEEFAPEVQGWIVEELTPEIQGWIVEEYSQGIQNWVTEEFSPVVDQWITEEVSSNINESMKTWCKDEFAKEVYENVNDYMLAKPDDVLKSVDSMLEAIQGHTKSQEAVEALNEAMKDRFSNNPVVEGMPSEYKPLWNMCTEAKKDDIIARSRLYDFTKSGVMESFWSTVDFNAEPTIVTEEKTIQENKTSNEYSNYLNGVIAQMKRMRGIL